MVAIRTAALVPALLVTMLCASEGSTLPLMANIGAGFGQKWMSEPSFPRSTDTGSAWEPIVTVIFGHRSLPVVLEGYASGTRQDGRPDTANDVLLRETRLETGLGLAGITRLGPIYTHLGGGIARISSKTRTLYSEAPEGSFTGTGHWIGGGAFFPLGAGFDVGSAFRYTNIDRHLDPHYGYELGGVSASALVGWGLLR